jgi:hypothetical protein
MLQGTKCVQDSGLMWVHVCSSVCTVLWRSGVCVRAVRCGPLILIKIEAVPFASYLSQISLFCLLRLMRDH